MTQATDILTPERIAEIRERAVYLTQPWETAEIEEYYEALDILVTQDIPALLAKLTARVTPPAEPAHDPTNANAAEQEYWRRADAEADAGDGREGK